jgi:hypothetical protein
MTKNIVALCLLAAALQACTYDLTLLPRGPGQFAHGQAHRSDKSVTIELAGHTYDGHFVYVSGGAFTLASVAGSGGTFATGTGIAMSASGNGSILASSPDGHNLRCVFNYSQWSKGGTGVCQTDDGTIYDLQITQR